MNSPYNTPRQPENVEKAKERALKFLEETYPEIFKNPVTVNAIIKGLDALIKKLAVKFPNESRSYLCATAGKLIGQALSNYLNQTVGGNMMPGLDNAQKKLQQFNPMDIIREQVRRQQQQTAQNQEALKPAEGNEALKQAIDPKNNPEEVTSSVQAALKNVMPQLISHAKQQQMSVQEQKLYGKIRKIVRECLGK